MSLDPPLSVGSLFSGVEGIGLGFARAGLEVAWQVEADEQCRSVLARHWPEVPKFDDVATVGRHNLATVDVLTGGFPCQDLSVAGRRAGLGGARSGLWWQLHRIVAELAPTWVVIENVPGLLSAVCPDPDTDLEPDRDEFDGIERADADRAGAGPGACDGGCMRAHGGAMGTLLGALGGLGYGFAYRVLDAQHFGLAQRRRRVFIVGRAGADRAGAASVLLEPESGSGRAAPRRASREDVAGTLGGGSGNRGWSDDLDRSGAFIPTTAATLRSAHRGAMEAGDSSTAGDSLIAYGMSHQDDGVFREEITANPIRANSHGDDMVARTLLAKGQRNNPDHDTFVYGKVHRAADSEDAETWDEVEVASTLNGHDVGSYRVPEIVTAFDWQAAGSERTRVVRGEQTGALTSSPKEAVHSAGAEVRRLIPVERERLQGFPDGWTELGADGRKMSDGARERMTGNAVAVPVAEWIGRRIVAYEEALAEN